MPIPAGADHPEQQAAIATPPRLRPRDRSRDHVVAVEADLVDTREQRRQRNRQPADRERGGALPPHPQRQLAARSGGSEAERRVDAARVGARRGADPPVSADANPVSRVRAEQADGPNEEVVAVTGKLCGEVEARLDAHQLFRGAGWLQGGVLGQIHPCARSVAWRSPCRRESSSLLREPTVVPPGVTKNIRSRFLPKSCPGLRLQRGSLLCRQ